MKLIDKCWELNMMDFNNPKKKKEEKSEVEKVNKKNSKPVLSDDELLELFASEDVTHVIELPSFPSEFYHYDNGKKVTNEMINEWIEECVLFLEQEQDEFFCTAQSGNTKIMVIRVFDDNDNYRYVIEVFKNWYSVEIEPEELS